jgi:hypothetical protein
MSGQTCTHAGCNQPRHMGKAFCLNHYKETDNYSYGLDADLKKKMDAKLDPQKLAQAQAWLEALSGVKSNGANFVDYLHDGQVLCKAINAIKPGSVNAINTSSMAFKQMENIANYLTACKNLGMKSSDQFMTRDLYESGNIVAVVDNIHALGSLSRKVAGFHGPHIGVKLSDEAKRDFTAEQLAAGAALPSRQNVGSYGYQDESKNPTIARQIVKNVSGHKASDAPSKQTQGSYGYQVAPDKSLDKIIKQPVNTPATSKTNAAPQVPSSPPPAAAAPAAAPPVASGAAKFCAHCGVKRTGGGNFCSSCGKAF